ncbi:MAG: hypothetical protein RJB16_271 [Bacteroidota bacterium]|jgi:hypothetical protein
MKEKDPLLKLIEDWTGKEKISAKILLGFISFFCILILVYGFYLICELFKFIF